METLKKYELPRMDISRFSSENIVTDSGIIASLEAAGVTAEGTVKIDFKDMLGFSE